MGIKLKDLVIKRNLDISQLKGNIIAIDAPNIIMGLFNFVRRNPDGSRADFILDRTQRPISHLYGLLYRLSFYYSKDILPIFCFDGRDSDLKKKRTKNLLNDFRATEKYYQDAISSGNKNLARKIALSKEYLWHNIIKESKELLDAFGVPHIESPASAESQCAQLVKDKIARYSNSQDYDSLLFGCPDIIMNLSKSLRRKVRGHWTYQKIVPKTMNLKENLYYLEIDLFQLIDLAILVGNDYFPGIKKIGPKSALKLVKIHKNLENILKREKLNYDFTSLTPEITAKVRKIFLFPDVITKYPLFSWNPPNEAKIVQLLCEEHYLNRERIMNNLKKLSSNFKTCRLNFIEQERHPRTFQKTIDSILYE